MAVFDIKVIRVTALAILILLGAPAQSVDLDNLSERGFQISGASEFARMGLSVSGAGDVNGDGLADLIIGAPVENRAEGQFLGAGAAYVIFGQLGNSPIRVDALGRNGFEIVAPGLNDSLGVSVSAAGDVNGDGLADVIVAAAYADGGRGTTFVVFGKKDNLTVNLAALGEGGFAIDGAPAYDAGFENQGVSGVGDVNGDGLADIVMFAQSFDLPAEISYVVFGKTDTSALSLAALGAGGFSIQGFATSVAGAGDVNGDGLADLILGDDSRTNFVDLSYVIFGKPDSNTVSLFFGPGENGFTISGASRSVSGAGDVNGDGLADLIVSTRMTRAGRPFLFSGTSYVVFGKTDNDSVSLGLLGEGGFPIDGSWPNGDSGASVAGAGDVNGDGLADVVIGDPRADPQGRSSAGSAYVVFGKPDSAAIALEALGNAGFAIDGETENDGAGISVSGAGDVNGDGLADVIIGASLANPESILLAGAGYVVFSNSVPGLTATYQARIGNGDAPLSAIGVAGDGSNTTQPESRVWVDFSDGNDPNGAASPVHATLNRSPGAFADATASVSWELSTARVNWSSAELKFRYLDRELASGANEEQFQIVHSGDGTAPFTFLSSSVVNPDDNTITATVSGLGFFYIGQAASLPDLLFRNGFE